MGIEEHLPAGLLTRCTPLPLTSPPRQPGDAVPANAGGSRVSGYAPEDPCHRGQEPRRRPGTVFPVAARTRGARPGLRWGA